MHSPSPSTSVSDLSLSDIKALGQAAWAQQKQTMYAKGIPTSKVIENKLYHEFPDGHLELVQELDSPSTLGRQATHSSIR